MLANFFGVEFYKDCIKVQEKKRKIVVLCSRPKHEIRHFHVEVVQRQLRTVQKSVMHVQSCCLANLNLSVFLPFSLPLASSLLNPLSPKIDWSTSSFSLQYQYIIKRKKYEI